MKTALIVDDHDENRTCLRTILSASGYTLLEASSGVEALEHARRERPAIIISDILMPQMDGFTFCRVCKRDPDLADIPFVFYTATYTSPQDEALAQQLGAARFIIKPVSDDVFVAEIAEVLEEHASGHLAALSPPADDETVYYRLYNEVLIHKLEEKVLELERQVGERVRAEAAIERASLQLRTVVTAANVGLWDLDLETNTAFYSSEWKRQIDVKTTRFPAASRSGGIGSIRRIASGSSKSCALSQRSAGTTSTSSSASATRTARIGGFSRRRRCSWTRAADR
jgi:CheY-like chemotaxis protein